MAEAEDLKSSKCGFDPHRGHAGFPKNESLKILLTDIDPSVTG